MKNNNSETGLTATETTVQGWLCVTLYRNDLANPIGHLSLFEHQDASERLSAARALLRNARRIVDQEIRNQGRQHIDLPQPIARPVTTEA